MMRRVIICAVTALVFVIAGIQRIDSNSSTSSLFFIGAALWAGAAFASYKRIKEWLALKQLHSIFVRSLRNMGIIWLCLSSICLYIPNKFAAYWEKMVRVKLQH